MLATLFISPCSTDDSIARSSDGSSRYAGTSPCAFTSGLRNGAADRLPDVFRQQHRVLAALRGFSQWLPGFPRRRELARVPGAGSAITRWIVARGSSFGTKSSMTLGFSCATRSQKVLASCRVNNSYACRRTTSVRCVPMMLTASTTVYPLLRAPSRLILANPEGRQSERRIVGRLCPATRCPRFPLGMANSWPCISSKRAISMPRIWITYSRDAARRCP